MSEPIKVTDPSQKYKLLIGIVALVLLGILVLGDNKGSFLGVELPAGDNVCNGFATGTAANGGELAPARLQASARWIYNGGPNPIFVFASSTHKGGIAVLGSTTLHMSDENGNLLRGRLYSSSSVAQTDNIRVYECP